MTMISFLIGWVIGAIGGGLISMLSLYGAVRRMEMERDLVADELRQERWEADRRPFKRFEIMDHDIAA
jgi:hypothetical protein